MAEPKSHSDDHSIRIDYDQDKVEGFLNRDVLSKQIWKVLRVKVRTYHALMSILDQNTLEHVEEVNKMQWKIPCLKRKNVRAVLIKKNGKLRVSKDNDSIIVWTNSIEKTEHNERWSDCPRMREQLDSTSDKLWCALACAHTWCAEKNLINMAYSYGVDLVWSKIILFGHTGWPCASCCETLAEKGIKVVFVWSPPEDKKHKDYDPQYANTNYKAFVTPSHAIRKAAR